MMLLIDYFYHIFNTLQLKPWPPQTVTNATAAPKSLCSKGMDNRRHQEKDADIDHWRLWLKKKLNMIDTSKGNSKKKQWQKQGLSLNK